MERLELETKPKFLVDERGKKKGVLITSRDFQRLEELIEDLEDTIDLLSGKISEAQIHFLDSTIVTRYTHIIFQKDVIFNTSIHGFSLATLQQKVCNQSFTLIVITTTDDFKFGAYIPDTWDCTRPEVRLPRSRTFSIQNLGYADVNEGQPALQNNLDYLLYLGNGDITVTEKKEGRIDPEKAYDIPPPFVSDCFYYLAKTFTAKSVVIYRAFIRLKRE